MLSRLQDFITRHRRKLIVTGAVVGGSIMAFKYAQRALHNFQERQAREFFERTRRMQHFESTERTCNQVILGMGSELILAILNECSTDALLQKLRQNPANKVELWLEIKIIAFTRLTALIYAASMLVVALRIQMNLLGGYLYRDIVTEKKQMTNELKQQYLSLIRHFIHDGGLRELIGSIRSKVVEIIGPLELNKKLCLSDLEQYFWSIQMSLNSDVVNDPNTKMSKYLLPAKVHEYNNAGPMLQQMHIETLDLLESEDAVTICSNNIARGFSLATDAVAEALGETIRLAQVNNNTKTNEIEIQTPKSVDFAVSTEANNSNKTTAEAAATNNAASININNVHIALAKIIPIICGITSHGFNSNVHPQTLAESLISFYIVAEKNKILGANVYETFSSNA